MFRYVSAPGFHGETVGHLTVVLTIYMLTKRKVTAYNMKNMQFFEALCYPIFNNAELDLK